MNPTSSDYPLFLMEQWRKLGHQVEAFPFDLEVTDEPVFQFWNGMKNCWIETSERRIARACRQFKPDVLLLMYYFMRSKAILRLREECRCIVGSYLDNNCLMVGETMQVLSISDFVIVHDSYVIPLIRGNLWGRNPNVFYMSGLAEPTEHKPLDLSDEDRNRYGSDVAYIGGAGADRVAALERLTCHDLKIWGIREDWIQHPHLLQFFGNEPVYGLKKTKIYNASKLVLSIEDREKQLNSLNPRIPETLACGGFILCNWSKDLEATGLKDGESLAWFRSFAEMEEKAAYYLTHTEQRAAVSRRGREVVLRSLTYAHVAPRLADEILGVLESRRLRNETPNG